MTIDEIIEKIKKNEEIPQPYGKETAKAYKEGKLECDAQTLYVIAFLLAEANKK